MRSDRGSALVRLFDALLDARAAKLMGGARRSMLEVKYASQSGEQHEWIAMLDGRVIAKAEGRSPEQAARDLADMLVAADNGA